MKETIVLGVIILFFLVFVMLFCDNRKSTRGETCPLTQITTLAPKEKVPTVQLVVARYNENVDWLNEPPFNGFDVIVYEKGPQQNSCGSIPNRCKKYRLPNVGREYHTYLYYIIQYYNRLPDIVIFCPGSVKVHERKIQLFKDLIGKINNVDELFQKKNTDQKKNLYHFTLDNTDENSVVNNQSFLLPSNIRPFGKWFEYHFSKNQKIYEVWYGGVGITTRERIRQRPLSFYKKLILELQFHSNPEASYYVERAWFSIFCKD